MSSSSAHTTLNIDDLNRLLFDMDYSAASSSTQPSAFIINPNDDFMKECGPISDGECGEESETVKTLRLIVNAHRAALATESLYEYNNKLTVSSHYTALAVAMRDANNGSAANFMPLNESTLDQTNRLAAVRAFNEPMRDQNNTVSPEQLAYAAYMSTPYLDSNLNTPYTPAMTFTPAMSTVYGSPHFSPFLDGSDMNHPDISVANYLKQEPAASFNGDPSQLLLSSSSSSTSITTPGSNTCDNVGSATSTYQDETPAKSSDNLFPPLPAGETPTSVDSANQDVAIDWNIVNKLLGFNFCGTATTASDNNTSSNNQSDGRNENKKDNSQSNEDTNNSTSTNEKPGNSGTSRKRKFDDNGPSSGRNKKRNTDNQDPSDRPYECPICQARFNRRYNLGTHMKTHDKNRQKDFICNLCNKGFDRKHDRERHVSTVHRGERHFTCLDCPASFSRKDALNRHMIQKHHQEGVA